MENPEQTTKQPPRRTVIHVTLDQPGAPSTILKFHEPFAIGCDPDSDLAIESAAISERHAEVDFEDECWWIRTVEGSKGIYLEGKNIEACPLATGTVIALGPSGPTLTFKIEFDIESRGRFRGAMRLPDPLRKVIRASTRIISVEEHKEILRNVIGRVEKMESRRYLRILGVVSILGLAASGYAYYKHMQYEKLEARAKEVFYQMKELEIGFSRLEMRLSATGDSTSRVEVARYWDRLKDLNRSYDDYVDELGVYKGSLDEKSRTIYHVARVFGECELDMPNEFVKEVERYIHEWKLSDRLPTSLQRARDFGYSGMIARIMLEQHLPPQFFYLALQESGFDSSMCGPPTRFGIAKGMWQFIPSTAIKYGLKTGPLVQLAHKDPRDERHRTEKSTLAAAAYLRDIYSTEAQASGLLVLASYNWGPNAVRGLIRSLPENPRERNFWAFLSTYRSRIPKETYDYVYYIFSAAVIGENPQLFGFRFEKPLVKATM